MSEEDAQALITELESLIEAHRGVAKYQLLSYLSSGVRFIEKDGQLYIKDKTE